MSDIPIRVEHLGKKYILSHLARGGHRKYTALRDVLAEAALAPFRGLGRRLTSGAKDGSEEPAASKSREQFWALKDVSFEIERGESVGIIGRNGAGKSTLLKLLSRITAPTTGRIEIEGKVASLLEVGTGFHPELTGRENIYLNGAILGMKRAEIKGKFDEIVAFAEVEKFLDTPVKHYSSGMYVRLAFAVAAHLEPDVLIVDEVLAVGDAAFQKKCLGKMQDASAREGRAVVFVSHNMAAISALTKRVLLMDKGGLAFDGPVQKGIDLYLAKDANQRGAYLSGKPTSIAHVRRVDIECSEPNQTHASGNPWSVRFQINYPNPVSKAALSFQIINQYQHPILHLSNYDDNFSICPGKGVTEVVCRIPELKLNVGTYYLKVYFAEPPGGETFDILDGVCTFDVIVLNRTTLYGWRPEICAYFETAMWSKTQIPHERTHEKA
jgi:lipopolysaccharide transport system ATP-binding protein